MHSTKKLQDNSIFSIPISLQKLYLNKERKNKKKLVLNSNSILSREVAASRTDEKPLDV